MKPFELCFFHILTILRALRLIAFIQNASSFAQSLITKSDAKPSENNLFRLHENESVCREKNVMLTSGLIKIYFHLAYCVVFVESFEAVNTTAARKGFVENFSLLL